MSRKLEGLLADRVALGFEKLSELDSGLLGGRGARLARSGCEKLEELPCRQRSLLLEPLTPVRIWAASLATSPSFTSRPACWAKDAVPRRLATLPTTAEVRLPAQLRETSSAVSRSSP
jgi:hypothetical protein